MSGRAVHRTRIATFYTTRPISIFAISSAGMRRTISGIRLLPGILLVFSAFAAGAQQTATRYGYLQANEALINAGMQALFTCNGLFVSNRTLDQLYAAELKMDQM